MPKYPLFKEIRDKAISVDLSPGDALFLPKLWWHQVEATAPFNGLVNYWWDAFSAGPDAPYTTLLLAMIAISERPPGNGVLGKRSSTITFSATMVIHWRISHRTSMAFSVRSSPTITASCVHA